jgi:hypothetical protein
MLQGVAALEAATLLATDTSAREALTVEFEAFGLLTGAFAHWQGFEGT